MSTPPPSASPTHDDDHGLAAAAAAEDWEACSRILVDHFFELTSRAGGEGVFALLARIPPEVRDASRGMRAITDYALHTVPAEEVPPIDGDLIERGGEEGLRELRELVLVGGAQRVNGRHRVAAALADAHLPSALAAFRRRNDAPMSFAAFFMHHAGVAYEMAGRLDDARQAYLTGWQWIEWDSLGFTGRDLASKLALLAAVEGDMDEADRWHALGKPLPTSPGPYGPTIEVRFRLAEAVAAIDTLDLDRARETLIALDSPRGLNEYFHYYVWARVHHLLATGSAAEAVRYLAEVTAIGQQRITPDSAHETLIRVARINALLAAGMLAEAEAEIPLVRADMPSIPLIQARLHALRGERAEALSRLTELSATAPRRLRLEAEFLEAACLLGLGRERAAVERFTRTVTKLGPHLRALNTVARADVLELAGLSPLTPAQREPLERWQESGTHEIYAYPTHVIALTAREQVILRLLAQGLTMQEIARHEVVSVNTVKTQTRSLYAKFTATGRRQLIGKAERLGFLP